MVKSEKLALSGSAVLVFKLFQNKLRGVRSHHTERTRGVGCSHFLKLFLLQGGVFDTCVAFLVGSVDAGLLKWVRKAHGRPLLQ